MVLLIRVFQDPSATRKLDLHDWDILIRQARHANLLGRLCRLLEAAGKFGDIPEKAANHLISGATMADRQHLSIRCEADYLRSALADNGIPLLLLKGAAYVLAELPSAVGRVFADVDILVPETLLGQAESALMLNGWVSSVQDRYDQHYYRAWMHELPPMQHMFRGTALDVHHTILPPTSSIRPDPALLIDASVEVPDSSGIRVLCPADLVLHSAAHLFHEGEADNLLRDLSDLDLLLRHFSKAPEFWETLTERAYRLNLQYPCDLALRYTSRIFLTPMPKSLLKQSRGIRQGFLDALYLRMLRPQHSSAVDKLTPLARKALYARAHWLRMPPHLLAYHLAHKFLFPPKGESQPSAEIGNNG